MFKFLFIYLKGTERQRERKEYAIHCFAPQKPVTVRAETGRSQELDTQLESPM